jgi:hypothetical protein
MSDLGTAASDIFGAFGSFAAAGGYSAAAKYAKQSANLSLASSAIKQTAEERQIEKVIGGQFQDVRGSGFEFSGSSLDIARDSASQGAISKAVIQEQGQIDYNNYMAQSKMYSSMASSSTMGGIGGLFSGVLALFSDARLKERIVRIAVDKDGKNVYEFNYIGDKRRFRGYIAQELEPHQVTDAVGFLMPDAEHRAEPV